MIQDISTLEGLFPMTVTEPTSSMLCRRNLEKSKIYIYFNSKFYRQKSTHYFVYDVKGNKLYGVQPDVMKNLYRNLGGLVGAITEEGHDIPPGNLLLLAYELGFKSNKNRNIQLDVLISLAEKTNNTAVASKLRKLKSISVNE